MRNGFCLIALGKLADSAAGKVESLPEHRDNILKGTGMMLLISSQTRKAAQGELEFAPELMEQLAEEIVNFIEYKIKCKRRYEDEQRTLSTSNSGNALPSDSCHKSTAEQLPSGIDKISGAENRDTKGVKSKSGKKSKRGLAKRD